MTKCLRKGQPAEMRHEVADVFAWICGVGIKIDSFMKESKLAETWIGSTADDADFRTNGGYSQDSYLRLRLSFAFGVLWKLYEKGCPICVREKRPPTPCSCPKEATLTTKANDQPRDLKHANNDHLALLLVRDMQMLLESMPGGL